jgi:hypothetical protein
MCFSLFLMSLFITLQLLSNSKINKQFWKSKISMGNCLFATASSSTLTMSITVSGNTDVSVVSMLLNTSVGDQLAGATNS